MIRLYAASTPLAWVYALVLAISSFQIVADPLGFDGLTERYAQQIINLTLTGPLYPDTGREQVSVALIEDDTLSNLGLNWPWPYGEHARALDAILAYGPRAVAVDILFADARDDPSLEQLLAVIERYARLRVPLYLVGAGPPSSPVRSELAKSSATVVNGAILFGGAMAQQYPEMVSCLDASARACPSLAPSIYEDALGGEVARSTGNMGDGGGETEIELVWGVDTHPINRKWMRVPDDSGNLGSCPPDAGIVTRLFRALVDVSRLRSPCPHTGTVPVEILLRGQVDEDVKSLIEDHVVFYGAALVGSQDLAFTPSNGLLPAVYVHAMALDNIVSFGGRPKRNTVSWFGVTLSNDMAKIVVAAFILLVASWLHIGHMRVAAARAHGKRLSLRRRFTWYGLLLVMVMGSGLLLYFSFGLSIGNWIELVFMSGLLFELLISPIPGRLWGRLRYTAGY